MAYEDEVVSASDVNWQRSETYDYTDNLVRADWAWEALRRNPEFRNSWHDAQRHFEIVEEHDDLRVIDCVGDNHPLGRWGCLYADPPDHDASSATVFWHPQRYSSVLPVQAFDESTDVQTTMFRLHEMNCATTLLLTDDGLQHMFVKDGGHGFQLAISGASLLRPVHLLADAVLDPKDVGLRLAAVQCFNDLRATGHLVPSHFPAEPASPRLRFVMQALDGALAGASHREIAVALFGAARVEEDWNSHSAYLRDRVRRAVKRGRALMNGGYLNFLR